MIIIGAEQIIAESGRTVSVAGLPRWLDKPVVIPTRSAGEHIPVFRAAPQCSPDVRCDRQSCLVSDAEFHTKFLPHVSVSAYMVPRTAQYKCNSACPPRTQIGAC